MKIERQNLEKMEKMSNCIVLFVWKEEESFKEDLEGVENIMNERLYKKGENRLKCNQGVLFLLCSFSAKNYHKYPLN